MLSEDSFRHHTGDVRQTKVSAGETVRESFVIQSEKVEHGGMEIVDVHPIFNGVVADLIRGAVDFSSLHAPSGHPDGVAVGIVIPSVAAFRYWRAAELTGPNDQVSFSKSRDLRSRISPAMGRSTSSAFADPSRPR